MVVALFAQAFPVVVHAEDPRQIDVCDYESVVSLLNIHRTNSDENTGSTETKTDQEERQESRNTARFSSTKKAEDCLKTLRDKKKIDGPNGAFVTGEIQQNTGGKGYLYKLSNHIGGFQTTAEMKVKGSPDGQFTVLKKGLFDRSFKVKSKEDRSKGVIDLNIKIATARFCGEKNWTLEKFEKEKKQCEAKFKTHTWDEVACECETDTNKVKPCPNGKIMTHDEKLSAKAKCEGPNSDANSKKFYEYDMDKCECEDTPKVHDCGPNFGIVGIREYERKKKFCELMIKIDPRRSWREASCDCPPVPIEKPKPEFCGKIKLKHPGHKDELRQKCLKKYNDPSAWNGSDCTCVDPCYTYIPNKDFRQEKCDITIKTIEGEWFSEVTGKVCDQPYQNEQVIKQLKDNATAYCKGLVQAEIDKFNQGDKTAKINEQINAQYVHPSGVICSTSEVTVNSESSVGEYFPDNVPTFDLDKFTGDCKSGYTLKDANLGVFRIHDNASKQDVLGCEDTVDNDYGNIKKGNDELVNQAASLVKDYMEKLGFSKPVTRAQLEEALKGAKINLSVLGTANRNNNNTAKTLAELANMRQTEAERLMKEQIRAQFGSYLGEGSGPYAIPDEAFTTSSVSKPVGPLSPEYPYWGSYGEVCGELPKPKQPVKIGSETDLAGCCSSYAKDQNNFSPSELYKCSVRQFFDHECVALASSSPKLHEQVCYDAANRRNKYLNAVKPGFLKDGSHRANVDPEVLEDFNKLKLFKVEASISASDKKPVKNDTPVLNVTCGAKVGDQQKTEYKDIPIYNLELKKPGILRRLKPGCRDEKKKLRKEIDQDFGEGTFKKLMKEGEITIDAPEGK